MDLVAELTRTAGAVGVVAAIFYKLYMDEKKEHQLTRDKLIEALKDRITDQKEYSATAVPLFENVTSTLRSIGNKIKAGKEGK